MSALDLLSRLKARHAVPPVRNIDRLTATVQEFQERYLVHEVEDDGDILKQLAAFKARLQDGDWSGYAWHRASGLLRGLFQSGHVHDQRWEKVTDTLLDTLEGTDKRAFLRAGVETYLRGYGNISEPFLRLSRALQARDRHQDATQIPLLSRFDIFREDAHLDVAEALGLSMEPYQEVKRWGIASPHMPGFFAAAFDEVMAQQTEARMNMDAAAFERVLNWLSPEKGVVSQYSRIACIDALLLPFHERAKAGPDALRTDIRKRLTRLFGDPRISATAWGGVHPHAMAVMRKWLAERSLTMFFEIINTFEGSHMWEPRRKFWTDRHDEGLIDEAWVVLNSEGQFEAQRLHEATGDHGFLSHGTITGGSEGKCYFIMRIGRLTVIEGTHSYALRFFQDDNEEAPSMNASAYHRNSLVSHHHDAKFSHGAEGNWMNHAFDYIRRHR